MVPDCCSRILVLLGLASSALSSPSLSFQLGFDDDTLANVRDRMLEIANAYPDLYWPRVPKEWREKYKGKIQVECHVHHRLVFRKIGADLSLFRNTRELCQSVHDAVVGMCLLSSARLRSVTAGYSARASDR